MADVAKATVPVLRGDAARAVRHRGSHVQIIASAGSGKTEVLSQRVSALLAEGVAPSAVVAFTFTERAARELKERIRLRVATHLGAQEVDRLSGLYVGTIHGYCFQLLQGRIPRYETYDVLDTNQLNAFLAREASRLGLKQLDEHKRTYRSISLMLSALGVIENELLEPSSLPDPIRTIVGHYLDTLERYRLLTFGQQVVRAVRELENPMVAAAIHQDLRHLVVDEYQDVNPAQERLIELLTGPATEVCVVGDDDQAIYQWRGSDVANIVGFAERHPGVAAFHLTTNRRSRPQIVATADTFARSIPGRIDKRMKPHREAGRGNAVAVWWEDSEDDEVGELTRMIDDLHDTHGVPYRDMAVLARSRTVYRKLLDGLAAFDIPVQPAGRTGLFTQPEARLLGQTVCWLTDLQWREGPGWGQDVDIERVVDGFGTRFGLDRRRTAKLRTTLDDWRKAVPDEVRTADLVREYYEVLDVLGVRDTDLDDPRAVNRLGTLARFSSLLADYESVRRRARTTDDGEQVGGQRGGRWYYRNLGTLILNYANEAYEGFDGEPDSVTDAVDVATVHGAKGLEWPVVFVPSLTAKRFPTSMMGRLKPCPVPRDMFPAQRYEGTDADERRLFYVAATRARDWLSLSRHVRPEKQATRPSPYWEEIAEKIEPTNGDGVDLPVDCEPGAGPDQHAIEVTFSEMATFMGCGMAYRLRTLLGFQPRLAPELGYGKAVHHVLRTVADRTKETGKVPSKAALGRILDESFFLPVANKPAHAQLKAAAERLVADYTTNHADDLRRVWETERPFELYLDGVTVSGRADVILDEEGGVPSALAILDYKTSTLAGADHSLQLQVYADAGRREGLDVRAAYVHDLKAGNRISVDVDDASIVEAERKVTEAAERMRARSFDPQPGSACQTCDVRAVCGSALAVGSTRTSPRPAGWNRTNR